MIDVIVPVHYRNAQQAVFGCLTHLADNTDVPIRFVVAGCGGARDDWSIVRDWLDCLRDSEGLHYGLLSTDAKSQTEGGAVGGVLDLVKHEHVMIIKSGVLLNDNLWFSKMRGPINVAPYVGGVFLPSEFSGSSTLEPNPLNEPTRIYPTSAVLTTRAHLQMVTPMPFGKSFFDTFQSCLETAGATRWSHPGVNFEVRDESATWARG